MGRDFTQHNVAPSKLTSATLLSNYSATDRWRIRLLKPLNLCGDWSTDPRLRRLPQHATRHIRSNRRNSDRATRQIAMFCWTVASA